MSARPIGQMHDLGLFYFFLYNPAMPADRPDQPCPMTSLEFKSRDIASEDNGTLRPRLHFLFIGL